MPPSPRLSLFFLGELLPRARARARIASSCIQLRGSASWMRKTSAQERRRRRSFAVVCARGATSSCVARIGVGEQTRVFANDKLHTRRGSQRKILIISTMIVFPQPGIIVCNRDSATRQSRAARSVTTHSAHAADLLPLITSVGFFFRNKKKKNASEVSDTLAGSLRRLDGGCA